VSAPSPSGERVVVLALAADPAAHEPVRRLLGELPRLRPEIHLVTDPASLGAALETHPHDLLLVEQDLGADRPSGLAVLADPQTALARPPALLLTAEPDGEHALAVAAAEAGAEDTLVVPDLTPAAFERALRRALARERGRRRAAAADERRLLALEASDIGVWDWDVATNEVFVSPRWLAALGDDAAQAAGPEGWRARIHPDDEADAVRAVEAVLTGVAPRLEHELRVRGGDGRDRWVLARGRVLRDGEGRALRLVGAVSDITERRETELRLQHDALHDALTGLPNRVLFLDRLGLAIRRAQRRHPGACAAVLFLDLDRFKLVNDSLGHQAGDQLLVEVARRLASVLRPNDTVARLGGDEFTILLDGVTGAPEASRIAERVQQVLRDPLHVADRELFVGASIGIALATGDATPEAVMRDADVAMYRAKGGGRARHAVFDARMHQQAMRRLNVEGDLRRAIEHGALAIAYQPVVQAATGRIAGFEALCRWPDGRGGFVDPGEFLPIAEETGLIGALGRWVLETACAEAAALRRTPGGAGLFLGVNVSGRELGEPDFLRTLREALDASGLDPRALRLEVDERALSRDPDGARQVLRQAQEGLGVQAHLDDFGAGASSLRIAHRFPGDAIKVWRGLVAGLRQDTGAFEIVRAIVGLAHNLGFEVIAEGVETADQLDHLKLLGCELAQGFHIAEPLAPEAARALVAASGGVPAR
jgi:diguanylate cyclase (GGDEF)-like protein/PAS domain S-box-containing protein